MTQLASADTLTIGTPGDQGGNRAPARHGWVSDYFGESYRIVYRHLVDETPVLERAAAWIGRTLAWAPDARVLDLACGYGRHMRHLRHQPGFLIGLDLLHSQLVQARRDMHDAPPALVQGDMRALPLGEGAFDVVLMLFNSFGYRSAGDTAGDGPEAALLGEIARVLRPRGQALLELPNRTHVQLAVAEQPQLTLGKGDIRLVEDWTVTPDGGLLTGTTTFLRWGTVECHAFALRLFALDEIVAMAQAAGMRPVATWGDLEGRPFRDKESEQLVIHLERTA